MWELGNFSLFMVEIIIQNIYHTTYDYLFIKRNKALFSNKITIMVSIVILIEKVQFSLYIYISFIKYNKTFDGILIYILKVKNTDMMASFGEEI